MPSLISLPADILAVILNKMPAKDRLAAGSTCSALRAALQLPGAWRSLDLHLNLELSNQDRMAGAAMIHAFFKAFRDRGRHTHDLLLAVRVRHAVLGLVSVDPWHISTMLAAFPALQALNLRARGYLDAGFLSSALASLTSLRLSGSLPASNDSSLHTSQLRALSELQGLRSLAVTLDLVNVPGSWCADFVAPVMTLTNLSCLSLLVGDKIDMPLAEQREPLTFDGRVTALWRLERLFIDCGAVFKPGVRLPPSLTFLHLRCFDGRHQAEALLHSRGIKRLSVLPSRFGSTLFAESSPELYDQLINCLRSVTYLAWGLALPDTVRLPVSLLPELRYINLAYCRDLLSGIIWSQGGRLQKLSLTHLNRPLSAGLGGVELVTTLTCLKLDLGLGPGIPYFLPYGPYLSRLLHLELHRAGQGEVPKVLRYCDNLVTLFLVGNAGLTLKPSCIETLSTLPALKSLTLRKGGGIWTPGEKQFLARLCQRCPALVVNSDMV